jgi:hypothetical protein
MRQYSANSQHLFKMRQSEILVHAIPSNPTAHPVSNSSHPQSFQHPHTHLGRVFPFVLFFFCGSGLGTVCRQSTEQDHVLGGGRELGSLARETAVLCVVATRKIVIDLVHCRLDESSEIQRGA